MSVEGGCHSFLQTFCHTLRFVINHPNCPLPTPNCYMSNDPPLSFLCYTTTSLMSHSHCHMTRLTDNPDEQDKNDGGKGEGLSGVVVPSN